MNLICNKCKAKFWKEEITKNVFSICCKDGKILLPNLQKPPQYLQHLLENDIDFKNKIRGYNSILAFTSLGANIDKSFIKKKAIQRFRIHGSVYHSIGSLRPEEKEKHLAAAARQNRRSLAWRVQPQSVHRKAADSRLFPQVQKDPRCSRSGLCDDCPR